VSVHEAIRSAVLNFRWYSYGLDEVSEADPEYADHLAAAVEAALEADQPNHIIEVRADGWTIQHSMACRIRGRLFDCEFNRAARLDTDDLDGRKHGRYVCHVDDGVIEVDVDAEVEL